MDVCFLLCAVCVCPCVCASLSEGASERDSEREQGWPACEARVCVALSCKERDSDVTWFTCIMN